MLRNALLSSASNSFSAFLSNGKNVSIMFPSFPTCKRLPLVFWNTLVKAPINFCDCSGPNLPIKIWFDERPNIKKDISYFIKKNLFYLENYVSSELAKSIQNDNLFKYDKNFEITFKILCLIIWLKLNTDKSILNDKISLENLLKY